MNAAVAYLAGLVTLPVVVLGYRAVTDALEQGHRSFCVYCDYETGPISTTRRITAAARWLWHEQVTRRTGGCTVPAKAKRP